MAMVAEAGERAKGEVAGGRVANETLEPGEEVVDDGSGIPVAIKAVEP